MIFTTRMKYVVAVVLDHDADHVTKELIRLGLVHFVKVTELKSGWDNRVNDVVPDVSQAKILELKKRVESFLSMSGIPHTVSRDLVIDNLKRIDFDATEKLLDDISAKIHGFRERQKHLQHEILKLEDIKRQVELFGDLRDGLKARSRYSFLNFQTGSVPKSRFKGLSEALAEFPSVLLQLNEEEYKINLLVITMKKDDTRVNGILENFGWLDTEIDIQENTQGMKDEVIGDLNVKLKAFTSEQEECDVNSKSAIIDKTAMLAELWENLRLNELYLRVRSYFSKTSRTILFSGWMPYEKQKVFEASVKKATHDCCYLEWSAPAEVEKEASRQINVPVEMRTPKFLSPFSMLVKNYGVPEYGSIDPSPFVAVAYMIMFGLMFGDVCQGLILVLAGILGYFMYKKKDMGMANLGLLIIWCGGAAIVFGALFGSYFGVQLFKPIWFDYHGIVSGHGETSGYVNNIYDILVITIYFGIIVISAGLVMNWINLIAKRRWFKLLLDKHGLPGGWIYGAGVYTSYYFATHRFEQLPNGMFLLIGIGIPMALLLLKPPLEFIIHKKHNPLLKFTAMTPVTFFMEWFVEILEIVGGFLANTLSFMRIAGFGIGHTSLMIAFFEMAKQAGPIGAIPVLIIGNALVISLEGLSAGIQSLRLNYIEFFSKYFTQKGKEYSPISLFMNSK